MFPAAASQFLMGACSTLRWVDRPELRARTDQVMAGLMACRAPDGSVKIPGVTAKFEKQWGYSWQMFTHALLEADAVGHPEARPLLRACHDWFLGVCADKPERFALQNDLNYQGHMGCTLLCLSAAGKPQDLANAERLWVDRKWIKALAARDPKAIWRSPPAPKWPHCYLNSALEAYLDHYLITGDQAFLDAMQGAWELMRENWIHIGGSMAICEHGNYPPKSYPITQGGHTGELCGNVFWIRFNHRLHRLFPDDERYMEEIERSIYNIGLAGQESSGKGMYYHLLLEGTKKQGGHPWVKNQVPSMLHTCCEGMGTWLYGALPQYIYSRRDDGLEINLYEASQVQASLGGQPFTLTMDTEFPLKPEVAITLSGQKRGEGTIWVRVPTWAAEPMPISVNGKIVVTGQPGTYAAIRRGWSDGDRITLRLPVAVRVIKYEGQDSNRHDRYALLAGPILLACQGTPGLVTIPQNPNRMSDWLKPVPGKPLHYRAEGLPDHPLVPYYQLDGDTPYTCFPAIQTSEKKSP
jgi:hypothetical protein